MEAKARKNMKRRQAEERATHFGITNQLNKLVEEAREFIDAMAAVNKELDDLGVASKESLLHAFEEIADMKVCTESIEVMTSIVEQIAWNKRFRTQIRIFAGYYDK